MSHAETAIDQLKIAHKLAHTPYEEMVFSLSAAWIHACLEIADAIREGRAPSVPIQREKGD